MVTSFHLNKTFIISEQFIITHKGGICNLILLFCCRRLQEVVVFLSCNKLLCLSPPMCSNILKEELQYWTICLFTSVWLFLSDFHPWGHSLLLELGLPWNIMTHIRYFILSLVALSFHLLSAANSPCDDFLCLHEGTCVINVNRWVGKFLAYN